MEKELVLWDRHADRLERRAGSRFAPTADGRLFTSRLDGPTLTPSSDSPPDNVDDLYDDLESASPAEVGPLIGRLSTIEAGWLARSIRERAIKEREAFHESVQQDLRVRSALVNIHISGANTIRRRSALLVTSAVFVFFV